MRTRMPTPSEGPAALPGAGIADDELELGFVSGFFGVRGEVRLHLHNRDSDLLHVPRQVVLIGPAGERFSAVVQARPGAGKRIIGRIHGVQRRDQAEAWHQWRVVVARADLPVLDEDEFYLSDVEGLAVHVDGERIGVVARIHTAGPVEIIEIDVGKREPLFVPCEADLVQIDIDAGVVHVVREGLA